MSQKKYIVRVFEATAFLFAFLCGFWNYYEASLCYIGYGIWLHLWGNRL